MPQAVCAYEVVSGAVGCLVGGMESWSWGPLLRTTGLSTGTVDETEERDSGEVSLVLEGVDPRQR